MKSIVFGFIALISLCFAQTMPQQYQAYDAANMQLLQDVEYYVQASNGTYARMDPSDITPADKIMLYSPSRNLCAWLNPLASQQLLYPCKDSIKEMYSIWDFPRIGVEYGIKLISSGMIIFVAAMLFLLWFLFMRKRV
jgi:hypothetical protein